MVSTSFIYRSTPEFFMWSKDFELVKYYPDAINRSKQTAFFKHTGFKGANSHIDDKYGVDVDDVFEIKDILSADLKKQFSIWVEKTNDQVREDELHLGYFKFETILNG